VLAKREGDLTNRMWFSVVFTLMDDDTRLHSGQNVVGSRGVAECVQKGKGESKKTLRDALTREALPELLSTTAN